MQSLHEEEPGGGCWSGRPPGEVHPTGRRSRALASQFKDSRNVFRINWSGLELMTSGKYAAVVLCCVQENALIMGEWGS